MRAAKGSLGTSYKERYKIRSAYLNGQSREFPTPFLVDDELGKNEDVCAEGETGLTEMVPGTVIWRMPVSEPTEI